MNEIRYRIGLLVVLFVVVAQMVSGQVHFDFLNHTSSTNFHEIVAETEAYFKDKNKGKGTGYKQFKRWEWYWGSRVLSDGTFPDVSQQANFGTAMQRRAARQSSTTDRKWKNVGYTNIRASNRNFDNDKNWGMGRIHGIAFHPTDTLTFYASSPGGGLWKTTDGGATYRCLTREQPLSVGVPFVAVDQINPSNIYIVQMTGLWKSKDAGETWEQLLDLSESGNVNTLRISPENSSVVMFTSNRGIAKSEDGGATWNFVATGVYRMLVFNPVDDQIVFATNINGPEGKQVYRSLDGGDTWHQLDYGGESTSFVNIATTSANPDMIVVASQERYPEETQDQNYYYVSYDNGDTFEKRGWVVNGDRGPLVISTANENYFYTGWYNVRRTPDAGVTWSQKQEDDRDLCLMSHWYAWWEAIKPENVIHTDQQCMAFQPLTHKLFVGNDGGLFSFNENTLDWTDLSENLMVTEIYSISSAQDDPRVILVGTQDNGGARRNINNTWYRAAAGDITNVKVDPKDHRIYYTLVNWGGIGRHVYDKGKIISDNIPVLDYDVANGAWVTPFAIDPINTETVYTARKVIYRSDDRGDTWRPISGNLAGEGLFNIMEIAPSNPNVIYAHTTNGQFFRTTTQGEYWEEFSSELLDGPTGSLTIHPNDHNRIWIGVGSYAETNKLLESNDGGQSWNDISEGLPAVPIRSAVYDQEKDVLYVGSDVGVYFYDFEQDGGSWQLYGVDLPFSQKLALDIQYSSRKLRVGTWGSGLWEVSIADEEQTEDDDNSNIGTDVCEDLGIDSFLEGTDQFDGFDIVSNSALVPNSNVVFRASNSIELTEGFVAIGELNFEAVVDTSLCEVETVLNVEEVISNLPDDNQNLKVHPNPAYSKLNFAYQNEIYGDLAISLYDLSGNRIIGKYVFGASPGLQTDQLSVDGLSKGVYILEVNLGHKRLYTRVAVIDQ